MKHMIRFMTIAMMLLVSTGFTACSDDDDDDKASWPTTGNAVFDEPYLGFGASISKVKGVMSGQRLHKEGTASSGSPYLDYYGTKSAGSYTYFFDKSTKKYDFSVVDIPINSSSDPLLEKTTTALASNYTFQYYDEEEGDFYFLTKDKKTEVMFTIYADDSDISLWIFFSPNSSSRSVRQMQPLSGKQPAWSAINKAKELIIK